MDHSLMKKSPRQALWDDEEAAQIAAAQKNPAAFGVLYDRYIQPVYRYFLSRTGSEAEAQDLVSQTFLTAFEAFPRYQHRGYFSAWLFRIAHNKSMDAFRREKRQDSPVEPEKLLDGSDLLQQVIENERAQALRSLLQSLREEEKELLRLRYVAGLGFAEIAGVLNRSEDAVKKSLYRLLDRMQTQLEDHNV